MTAPPGDGVPAGPVGVGRMRASHSDRDHVVGMLKAAFVRGRLAKDEFAARVGQALTAQTYGDLDVLTTDLAASPPLPGPAGAPARTPGRKAARRGARWGGAAAGAGLVAGVLPRRSSRRCSPPARPL